MTFPRSAGSRLVAAAGITWLRKISLFASLYAMLATAAIANEQGLIFVVAAKGDISLSGADGAIQAEPGISFSAPVSIRTAADGYLTIRQAETTIEIKPETTLDIPLRDDNVRTIESITQKSGSVYYEVEKHRDASFKVETPFLVSVVKGTAFNVFVGDNDATVALVEGNVDVISGDDLLEMFPGDVAIGSLGDLQVIRPDDPDLDNAELKNLTSAKTYVSTSRFSAAANSALTVNADDNSDSDDFDSDDDSRQGGYSDSDLDFEMDDEDFGEEIIDDADLAEDIDDADSDLDTDSDFESDDDSDGRDNGDQGGF